MSESTKEIITHTAMALIGLVICSVVGFWWGLVCIGGAVAIGVLLADSYGTKL